MAELPPPSSLASHRHNLTVQPTPFIGRQREIAALHALLGRDDVRLVTLTGPGGSGKTRLGVHVAADLIGVYPDGVFCIDLAPISDPALVAPTIAQVLGVGDTPTVTARDALVDHLRTQRLLLMLDNFEQVLGAALLVDDLLRSCRSLKILITSRAPLQVRGEHELPVPPLTLPNPGQTLEPGALSQCEAVALFVDRAAAVRPSFTVTIANAPAVAEICLRLDGLPLAIELAAARLRLLTPEVMLPRLGHRLALLTGGRRDLPARQQTLRDTIAWSYDLLSAAEQRLFRRLSVFVGGFTLQAAEAICAEVASSEWRVASERLADSPLATHGALLDVAGALVDNSLVRAEETPDGQVRLSMLETIREYGLEQLSASGEMVEVRGRHLDWCLELAEQIGQQMGGPAYAASLARFDAEHDNLRAALRWSEQEPALAETGLRVASRLANGFWTIRGHFREGRTWLGRLLACAPARTVARAQALHGAGYLALRQNDYPVASEAFEEALSIWDELGDSSGKARTLREYGTVPHHQRDYARARVMLDEGLRLSRELGDERGVGTALRNLADLARDCAEYPEAVAAYQEALSMARKRGDAHAVAYSLRGLGHVARAHGEYQRAREYLSESLSLLRGLGDRRCIPLCLEGLACVEVGVGWAARVARLLGAAHATQAATGAPAPPSELADYQRTEVDARASLGAEGFAAIWAAGAAMSLDEAVGFALGEPPSPTGSRPATSAAVPTASNDVQTSTATLESSAALRPRGPVPAGSASMRPKVAVPLSPREREVVALVANGLSNRDIAERLQISVRTVERHIENVYGRLDISGKAGRAIVTAYALRHGLVALN